MCIGEQGEEYICMSVEDINKGRVRFEKKVAFMVNRLQITMQLPRVFFLIECWRASLAA
jgi:hypothetical protein